MGQNCAGKKRHLCKKGALEGDKTNATRIPVQQQILNVMSISGHDNEETFGNYAYTGTFI